MLQYIENLMNLLFLLLEENKAVIGQFRIGKSSILPVGLHRSIQWVMRHRKRK